MFHNYLWQSYDKYTNKGILQNWYVRSQSEHQRAIIFWWPHVTIIVLLWMFHEQNLLKIKICTVRLRIMYSTRFMNCNTFKIKVVKESQDVPKYATSKFLQHASTNLNSVTCSCYHYGIFYAMEVKHINIVNTCTRTLDKHRSATEITCNKRQ
jgi:hypothetical protein